MSESNTPMLGLLIEGEANRDAIHIAIAPVTCDEIIQPGTRVALVEGTSDKVKASVHNTVGIVDPFLRMPVPAGRKFWLCLYCRTVTSLRHEWTHPAFKSEQPIHESVEWLKQFGRRVGFSYNELINLAEELERDGGATVGDETNQERFDDEKDEFLKHLHIVTGRMFKEDVYFSCAC